MSERHTDTSAGGHPYPPGLIDNHPQPLVDWKARALAAEAERDKLLALFEQHIGQLQAAIRAAVTAARRSLAAEAGWTIRRHKFGPSGRPGKTQESE